jgi:hypothetical protein
VKPKFPIYNRTQVSKVLRVQPRTVFGGIKEGKIKGVHWCGAWHITRVELDRFLRDHGLSLATVEEFGPLKTTAEFRMEKGGICQQYCMELIAKGKVKAYKVMGWWIILERNFDGYFGED